MPCETVKLPGGHGAIICTRRPRRRRCSNRPCVRWSTKVCDYPKAPGKTCDKPLCSFCAVRIGSDVDHCPNHPKTPPAQLTLGIPE